MTNRRRARATIRCLTDDLGLDLPSLDTALDALSHPWLDEVRRVVDVSPEGQKRIESIGFPLVFRLRISDHRGATWVDDENEVVWLCAVHKREDGSEDDAYEWFCDLHRRAVLLPDQSDRDRLQIDTALELFGRLRRDLLQLVDDASARSGVEIARALGDWLACRVVVNHSFGMQEIWCALSVRDEDGNFISERLRDALFVAMEQHLAPVEMEARHDWPSGEVEWFEVVRLGVR